MPLSPEGPLDRRLLAVYLNDHVAGATAGQHRMAHTAEVLAGTPVGPLLAQVADELAEEREHAEAVLDAVGRPHNRAKRLLAGLAEVVARVKPSGRLAHRSPATTLLEVELLRSALVGKMGLFQVMVDLADEVPADRVLWSGLLDRVHRQIADLDEVHAWVRVRALRQND